MWADVLWYGLQPHTEPNNFTALKLDEKINVVILDFDNEKKRIALGLKQLQENPWVKIAQRYPLDTQLEAEVSSLTEFGVFAKIDDELEGLIYSSEIEKETVANLKPGDKIKVKVIKVDVEQAKIGLTARL